jgi:hypothetical protein
MRRKGDELMVTNNDKFEKALNQWKTELSNSIAEINKQMNDLISEKENKDIELKVKETILEDLNAPGAIDLTELIKEINVLETKITDLKIAKREKEDKNVPFVNAIDKRLALIKEQNRVSAAANQRTK